MARRRFFVQKITGGTAELGGEDGRHLALVLRAQTGQQFEISDNRAVYLAEVSDVRKDRVLFRVLDPVEPRGLPFVATVYAALIKFDRFEWMVEKLTELGAASIIPVEAARSEKGLANAAGRRVERWRRIAREASQQARRDRIPEIGDPLPLDEALRDAAADRYFLDEKPGLPPFGAALPAGDAARISLLTGPEGGWTDGERSLAEEAGWPAVSLGPHVMRAETAAIAAFSVLACTGWAGGTR